MDLIYRVISIILIFIIILMGIVAWLWYRNPYYLISWWNQHIKSECDQQDSFPMNGIPSFQNAWASNNKSVLEFHRLIHINHDEIYSEVMDIINNQNNFIESKEESSDLLIQRKWLKQENRWNPMWIRFMGDWSKISDKTPTLKRIASLFPEVTSLHISIFNPGTTIIENQGPSRSVHRYHYGLKIPEGDVGLKIAGYDVKWKEREGFIWDDTIPHSAWNHTSEPRIVIFADILRDLSIINSIGSRIIYSLVQRTKHVSQIKTQLQNN